MTPERLGWLIISRTSEIEKVNETLMAQYESKVKTNFSLIPLHL